MFVRYGFTIEIYGCMHSLRTFWLLPLGCHRTMAWRSRSNNRKIEDNARMSPGRRLTAQQKDERRQDNGDENDLHFTT